MSRHVHVLGICGYATSGAALLAQQAGDRVTGSDDFAYPPVSDIITNAGIQWQNQSDPHNLDRWGVPDLVVVGNQTRPNNPEWHAVQQRGLAVSSEIEFYVSLAAERIRLAVCGTHGKTTTSALLVHMLHAAGLDPGFRLGSTSLDVGGSALDADVDGDDGVFHLHHRVVEAPAVEGVGAVRDEADACARQCADGDKGEALLEEGKVQPHRNAPCACCLREPGDRTDRSRSG